jgi:hypothetical protein
MSPLRFAGVLLRYVGGQAATVGRSLGVMLRKGFSRPKPVVFDRTPKRGA